MCEEIPFFSDLVAFCSLPSMFELDLTEAVELVNIAVLADARGVKVTQLNVYVCK